VVRQTHHPEQSRRGIQLVLKVLRNWMPDQVRHDRQNLSILLNCDTVWEADIVTLSSLGKEAIHKEEGSRHFE
jgi:hypothetical protein